MDCGTGVEVAVAAVGWGVSPATGGGSVAGTDVAVGSGVDVAAELQATAKASNQGMNLTR